MSKRYIVLALLALQFAVSTTYADGGVGGRSHPSAAAERGRSRTKVVLGADSESTTEAVAHYARARSLVIAALHEFDQARKIASPSQLLDPVAWRNTLIDRAEDLDRLLDPQPRATKGGIRFEADPRLLPEATR
jgi:hypothetical protein